jgi:hypothetical protein
VKLARLFGLLVEPFRTPPTTTPEEAARQAREAEAQLRQLRNELRLVRLWKQRQQGETAAGNE